MGRSRIQCLSLDMLPDLALERIAAQLSKKDKLNLMVAFRNGASVSLGSGRLRLLVDDRVKWTRLKQFLQNVPWAAKVHRLIITSRKFDRKQPDQTAVSLAAVNVLLGPADSTLTDGVCLAGIKSVTVWGDESVLPCLVPHNVASVCPNMTSFFVEANFVKSRREARKIPLCRTLRHLKCRSQTGLPPAYQDVQDLEEQLPNIISLKLGDSNRDWQGAWSSQLTQLETECSMFGSKPIKHTAARYEQLKHFKCDSFLGSSLPIHSFAPAVEILELPDSCIEAEFMPVIRQLTRLQSLTVCGFGVGQQRNTECSLHAILPSLTALNISFKSQ